MNNKLNTKLIKSFISLLLIFVIITWFFQILLLNNSYSWFRKNDIKNAFNQINDVTNLKKIENISEKLDSYIFIYDKNRKIVFESYNMMPKGIEKEITNAVTSANYENIDKDLIIGRFQLKYNFYGRNKNNNYILLITKLDPIESSISIISRQLIYVTIISIIIALIISVRLSKKLSSPINKINEKAKQLGKGNFDVEFTEDNYLEVRELSKTMNETIKKLKEKDKLQKEIIANVSHDLKTPLTIIKGYAEVIKDIKNTKKQRDLKLNRIIDEAENLNTMINNMLEASKLEADLYLNLSKTDISRIIDKVLLRLEKIITDNKIKVIFNKEKLVYAIDQSKFEQVIYNLLINAINHIGFDNTLIINIKDNKLEIIDHGQGIENTTNIFDKFYTTHNNKNSNGLGLYIVKTILEKHNLEYGVDSQKNNYTNFWIKF